MGFLRIRWAARIRGLGELGGSGFLGLAHARPRLILSRPLRGLNPAELGLNSLRTACSRSPEANIGSPPSGAQLAE